MTIVHENLELAVAKLIATVRSAIYPNGDRTGGWQFLTETAGLSVHPVTDRGGDECGRSGGASGAAGRVRLVTRVRRPGCGRPGGAPGAPAAPAPPPLPSRPMRPAGLTAVAAGCPGVGLALILPSRPVRVPWRPRRCATVTNSFQPILRHWRLSR